MAHWLGTLLGISLVASTAGAAPTTDAATHPAKTKAKAKPKHASNAKPKAMARITAQARPEATDPSRFASPTDIASMPAYRYGQLSQADCEAELVARKIPFTREEPARGVLAPVRLTGPLHGVVFRSDGTDKVRATSPYEIADCRLILAMDDFAVILSRHDIVEVRHYSMYRPPEKSWPDDKLATRHAGALALDAGRFIDSAGGHLDVDKDFHGAIDAKTCGDGAGPQPVTDEATRLRAILCETVDAHLFNVVLTPNYNKPHHNHFHLEVTAGVKWFLVH